MQHSFSVPWRALKVALGLGAAAAASLAFAGGASAAVIVIQPDNGSGTDNLTAAITTANTNTSTSNTIVLSPGVYQPKTQPITITKNLNIVADHSFQSTNSTAGIEVNGATANLAASNNFLVINHGVNVTLEGFNLDAAGSVNFSTIVDNGNLTLQNMEEEGEPGYGLNVGQTGVATMNDSTITFGQADSVFLAGSLTMNNSSVTQSNNNGLDDQTGYHLVMNNSLVAGNGQVNLTPANCTGAGSGVTSGGGPGSMDDNGSCHVQYNGGSTLYNEYQISPNTNGGPTTSVALPAGNPTTGLGVNCPTTDQRFFVNPVVGGVTQCDIGSITNSATQETTPPSCTVTNTVPNTSQQVSLVDPMSGIGPQPPGGTATDNPSNTPATAYPPPMAVPVGSYAVDNLQINNGSVALTPFTAPSTSPLVLTATKTTGGQITQWSFTGLNWAGIAKNCF